MPLALLALSSILVLVAAACGGGTQEGPRGPGGSIGDGGVYRTAIEDFGFTGAFDPTGEYLGTAWGLYSQLMLRTLVTYKHVKGTAGDDLVPDIATDLGKVSSDGLTYTFTLKNGITYGPPLSREITSKDIEYAFRRIETSALVAQYGFYYDGVIEGMDGAQDKMPADISGIDTPDDHTIVFHLEQATGDFLYRLAMPATAPIPEEVGKCFTRAGDYGRDVISTGPYMIKGADQVDVSSCKTIKPMSGFDPTKKLVLVRNPNYDKATDTPEVRSNHIDGVSVVINSNTDDIFNQVEAGALDGSLSSTPPAQVEQRYLTDPVLKPRLHADSGDRTWYIYMNFLTPPFDDVHVRKAVNFIIDKATLQRAWGGPVHGEIATHIMPPTVLDFGGERYDPYPSANHTGDLNAAKNEMKLSAYDANQDGLCDSPVCKNVLFVNRTSPPHVNMTPTIQNDLAQLGIDLKVRELDTGTAYTTIQTVHNLVPIASNAGWGKDYADASTFAVLFHSSGINCEGQINYSEVGMTAEQARRCHVTAQYNAGKDDLPNVDPDIDRCIGLQDQARTQCWVALDKKLMEQVVPWVPYLWATNLTLLSDKVTHYEFDQFSGIISLCHIAVNNRLSAASL
ncbi:MAG TPA: ABC transporter substrate-binding protein [Actinomycetota bacterium]|nr:ABC transporter substrate-binding protein [Actinomycetota bacterium]